VLVAAVLAHHRDTFAPLPHLAVCAVGPILLSLPLASVESVAAPTRNAKCTGIQGGDTHATVAAACEFNALVLAHSKGASTQPAELATTCSRSVHLPRCMPTSPCSRCPITLSHDKASCLHPHACMHWHWPRPGHPRWRLPLPLLPYLLRLALGGGMRARLLVRPCCLSVLSPLSRSAR
jgi:hypothetical protein